MSLPKVSTKEINGCPFVLVSHYNDTWAIPRRDLSDLIAQLQEAQAKMEEPDATET